MNKFIKFIQAIANLKQPRWTGNYQGITHICDFCHAAKREGVFFNHKPDCVYMEAKQINEGRNDDENSKIMS